MKQLLTIIFSIIFFASFAQNSSMKIGRLVYQGGGDWYANPTSLPNLIAFCNKELKTNIQIVDDVDVGSSEIYNYPFIHMTGHGNVVFNFQEVENLRSYLLAGGFLHIDDNYGMDPYIRTELKKVFPEYDLIELPYDHPIYHQKFKFSKGLPKIHEHDERPPKGYGIFHKGRLIIFYTYECDLGDGWEDPSVHNDTEDARKKALKMGANMIQFLFMSNE